MEVQRIREVMVEKKRLLMVSRGAERRWDIEDCSGGRERGLVVTGPERPTFQGLSFDARKSDGRLALRPIRPCVGLGRDWGPCLASGPCRSSIQNSCPELRKLRRVRALQVDDIVKCIGRIFGRAELYGLACPELVDGHVGSPKDRFGRIGCLESSWKGNVSSI
ncbi:hypothetical protein PIB30_020607 [Stylosanthes scabra]|uniref:Uncharacterized protein n=1 Tax=Stylosanthes scabra TaxID=79078 RepID=A0ABU6R8X0_9FABA|nr:hypothetical protein [Stylosanthes scabra]